MKVQEGHYALYTERLAAFLTFHYYFSLCHGKRFLGFLENHVLKKKRKEKTNQY